MNWGIFEYAGPTVIAWIALVCSAAVFLLVCVVGPVIVWCRCGGRRRWIAAYPLALAAVWGCVAVAVGPRLGHAWLYLQENATRTWGGYAWLTFATAFFPPSGGEGRHAFVRIAARDTGFGRGRPRSVARENGRKVETYADEDYPGGVTVMDGRPVDTGTRFRHARTLPGLAALFAMPNAKTFRLEGAEGRWYGDVLKRAGLKATEGRADIILVAPLPDWIVGSDFPDADDWRRFAAGLSCGGVVVLHLDARLLSRSRFKAMLEDFRAAFDGYSLWCAGRFDYALVSLAPVLADELLDLFSDSARFAVFAESKFYTPAAVLAAYVGTDREIEPGLAETKPCGRFAAKWNAPRLAFSPLPEGGSAPLRAAAVTPYFIPPLPWLQRGIAAPEVFASLTNGYDRVQAARREFLVGLDDADQGVSTNALRHWETGAEVNPRDPLLASIADSLDLEGRRFLRIGNAGAAMRCYENRLSVATNDVAAVHNFGVCLKRSGHPDMAASVFARAVQMDPLVDEHRLELIETCAASSREDVACRQLDVLMRRHPEDPALKMRAARLLCLPRNKARDPERAVKLAEEAVKMTGWKERAYVLGLADVYIESGRVRLGAGLKKRMREMKFAR